MHCDCLIHIFSKDTKTEFMPTLFVCCCDLSDQVLRPSYAEKGLYYFSCNCTKELPQFKTETNICAEKMLSLIDKELVESIFN